ncbi:Serine/threonine kinase [Linnemannia exigua]|uniref:Serine/threonine kinase n=1 Tax=Linnemannia exigua TaxID=604196 RepID=A0AAD4D396_9FUNG|nr:Serine/threonine kinase [Linnemannia exigua]
MILPPTFDNVVIAFTSIESYTAPHQIYQDPSTGAVYRTVEVMTANGTATLLKVNVESGERQGSMACLKIMPSPRRDMAFEREDLHQMRLRLDRRFQVTAVAIFVREIVKGMQFIHSQGFCHRDIKPENVIITASGAAKICDFGVAERLNAYDQAQGKFGTYGYMAPEVSLRRRHNGFLSDSFSLGGLLHFLSELTSCGIRDCRPAH